MATAPSEIKNRVESVALFFYLAFLDEALAIKTTLQTLDQMEKRLLAKAQDDSRSVESILVYQTYKNWRRYRNSRGEIITFKSLEANWQIPPHLDLGPWRQLHKEGNPDEILAVIWHEVLGITPAQIAAGLGLSVGTVRYRIGNGLRQLGPMILPGRVYA